MNYYLVSIFATQFLAYGKTFLEMTGPGNILIFCDILGVLDGRHSLSYIILLRAELPYINGHHGSLHLPMKIYVVVHQDDQLLTGGDIMVTSNQKKEASK